ncbi:MAG: hypothetical protein JW910_01900, partial [Anaerolineae bacterium]|nr:hypothetical protein [Anaerolineae bacterium]
LIIESWFTPEQWHPGHLSSRFVDEPDLRLARMVVSEQEGSLAVMDMHHLVGTPEGVHHFVERHEMMLFTHEEYLAAFAAAGLTVSVDVEGLIGRALYIGVTPPA